MSAPRSRGAGIPRLQELSFLEVAARKVAEGGSFDDVRRALIDHMAEKRAGEAPTGNHAVFRLARHNPQRYVSNATEALAELMRLGLLDKSALPSTAAAAAAYQQHRFLLTPEGKAWAAQLDTAKAAAYNDLLGWLWRLHPQFAGYLRLVARSTFVVPTARWAEVHQRIAGEEGRLAYVEFLATRASKAVEAGVTGWRGTRTEILTAVRTYIEERLEAADRRQRPHPYPRHQDFVGACEEALVSFAFRQAGMPLDYISHEILRRWTKDLGVANFSYHVPGPPALRLWSTAELTATDTKLQSVRRRTVAEYGDRVIDELPDAYEQARRQDPGRTWVPIYRVRAAVAARLRLNDPVVDTALREFIAQKRRPEAPFRLSLDPVEFGSIPPSEAPLYLPDRTGRPQVFHVMSLVRRPERSPA